VTFNQLLWIALQRLKGKQVNIPASGRGDCAVSMAQGAVTQLNLLTLLGVRARDLFSGLNSHDPGIGSAGDRVVVVVKHRGYCGVSCAPCGP
jgi:hypothetical protein